MYQIICSLYGIESLQEISITPSVKVDAECFPSGTLRIGSSPNADTKTLGELMTLYLCNTRRLQYIRRVYLSSTWGLQYIRRMYLSNTRRLAGNTKCICLPGTLGKIRFFFFHLASNFSLVLTQYVVLHVKI
jgi:hypothetical protein